MPALRPVWVDSRPAMRYKLASPRKTALSTGIDGQVCSFGCNLGQCHLHRGHDAAKVSDISPVIMFQRLLQLSIAIVISSSLGPGLVNSGLIIEYHPPSSDSGMQADQPRSSEGSPVHRSTSGIHLKTPSSPDPQRNSHQEEDSPCPECEQERQLNRLRATHTEEEIRKLRIEHIKEQILRKLRLNAPPNITGIPPRLPEPLNAIFREEEMAADDPSTFETDVEEFYGKQTEIIVFGSKMENCEEGHGCFHFELENKLDPKDMQMAELWVYKLPESRQTNPPAQKKLTIFDLAASARGSSKVLQEKEVFGRRSYWVHMDFKHTTHRWLSRPSRNHGIQISCSDCKLQPGSQPVQATGENKPFLVIHTQERKPQRKRRQADNCEVSSCCKESFYVDFEELGWHNWIINPKGYQANYCRGNCRMLPSINRNRSNHWLVHILQKASQVRNDENLLPCCAPTRMSSRSMLYYNDTGEVIVKHLPNMVVESCGCS